LQIIRTAAHEVQRPVFYSIGIIITAYIPIFTLQRVEGRLFKPMAWTVAFALLGALMFSMLIAPVLASFCFRRRAKEWRNPLMTDSDAATGKARPQRAIRFRWVTVAVEFGAGRDRVSGCWPAASSARSFCRIWTKAPSGRAATLAPSTGPTEGVACRIRRA
jgi:cobalt-zinc-cadmium resistance protein CzcA